MKLSPKRMAFVVEYCVDWNATQAAIRAGYSKKTARSQGQRLLTNADIKAALEKKAEEFSMGKGERLALLADIARGKGEETTSDRMRAIDIVNKVAGDYIEKREEKSDTTIRFVWATDD